MPQSRSRRAPAGVHWIAWPGLGLGAIGAGLLLAWERPLGLPRSGALFLAVVALTAVCGAAAVLALLRWIAADRRSSHPDAERPEHGAAVLGSGSGSGEPTGPVASAAQRAPGPSDAFAVPIGMDRRTLARRSRTAALLPPLLLALALLVCLGLSALFFLLPTNDDDPWIPWAASALVFVALAIRPIRMFASVRRMQRDATASERSDGVGDVR